jgi:DNA-binding response OmpR family regulator
MSNDAHLIAFVDNMVSRLYKTLERLQEQGYHIKIYTEEKELLEQMREKVPEVIFINLDLKPNDAIVLANDLRSLKSDKPPFVIIYSDKQEEFVQELAFNSGADSYITFHAKPAVMSLFLRNLLRRSEKQKQTKTQALVLDVERFLIYKNGTAYQLPRKEFRLFALLYNNPLKFFTKSEIAVQIWKDEHVGKKRIIDVHIYNIRQIFGKRSIQSQKGKGYRFNSEPS